MNDFLRRIKRLKKELNVVDPLIVTLIYMDGSERTMDDEEAFEELCVRGDIKAVRCAYADLKSLFDAMLPGCDCANWDEDDSGMIAGVE